MHPRQWRRYWIQNASHRQNVIILHIFRFHLSDSPLFIVSESFNAIIEN